MLAPTHDPDFAIPVVTEQRRACARFVGTLTSKSIPISLDRMRTTLDLPTSLLDEAQRLLGFKSKTDTIILSLTELVRRRRIDELKNLMGRVELDIDLDHSRRRIATARPKTRRRPRTAP
jgi:hypothetical protein